jgi:hypothetical protein
MKTLTGFLFAVAVAAAVIGLAVREYNRPAVEQARALAAAAQAEAEAQAAVADSEARQAEAAAIEASAWAGVPKVLAVVFLGVVLLVLLGVLAVIVLMARYLRPVYPAAPSLAQLPRLAPAYRLPDGHPAIPLLLAMGYEVDDYINVREEGR